MTKVSSVVFHYVLKALEAKTKIPLQEMLNRVNLTHDTLMKHDGKIDSDKLSTIFRYCMTKTDNPNLALDIGESVPYQSLGILGYLLLNTTTLKEMIEKFNHYQKLISETLKFNFSEDENYYKFAIYINENRFIPVPSFHAEVHLTSILNILSQILGERVIPTYTYFSKNSIENPQRYREIFGENIYLNMDENAIFFDKDKLNIPINSSNPSMLAYFEAQANRVLQELENNSWYGRVEKEILKNIGDKEITIEFVAKNLNISVRTLQNYLKSESKKFSEALKSVRKKLSEYYIKNTKLDDTTISFLLGYSEVSSFYRAYKKWNNSTPKEIRNLKK